MPCAVQCAKMVEEFGLLHLSAGDLLRAHMKSGTPDGNMVADMIKQGQIVPSRVCVPKLQTPRLCCSESQNANTRCTSVPRGVPSDVYSALQRCL